MRRRSLRLPSPKPFRNSDGNTGAFFRAENYRREFYVPKTEGLNVQVFALRVNFSEGTCQVKRGLWRNFMEEYGLREATLISPAIAIGEIWYFSHFFPIE